MTIIRGVMAIFMRKKPLPATLNAGFTYYPFSPLRSVLRLRFAVQNQYCAECICGVFLIIYQNCVLNWQTMDIFCYFSGIQANSMIRILGERNSVINQFIAELRDVEVQKDLMRFRKNLERVGEIFAYEVSKELTYQPRQVQTPLGIAEVQVPADQLVLATILRAGLPLHQGMLNFFDRAENAFISAYRKYSKDGSFKIQFEHLSCPSIAGKTLVVIDPMLATGASMLLAYKALIEKGLPKHTHIVSVIASREGVDYMKRNLSQKNVTLWLGAVDDELTVKAYIVPGLGDAGDLAYGSKE
jgi:uracil phosphoribosyltransferase